ncbi:M48 family metalloprotease [Nonomuraea sp. NPDC000554]|uniref:M48 family metalloprotease n=1 Tax=Nonomuraea sp. NPDC000554 TaxID=3154259 RepID=UPI00332A23D3
MPTEKPCPKCGVAVVKDGRYPSWCPSCEWNLPARPRRRRLGVMLADRLTAGLHAQVLKTGVELVGGGFARVASSLLAALIHLLTLSAAVAGVWVAVLVPNVVGFALGALLLGVAWLMRPRLGRLSKKAPVLTRESAPRLFGLLDRVGAEVGADRVDAVLVWPAFQAAFAQLGLRGTRVLFLGAPLWAVLEPQERVALLAHELSHSSNGDCRHGRLTSTAISALYAVQDATRSTAKTGEDTVEAVPESIASLLAIVLVAVMRLAGIVIGLLSMLLVMITARSSRQAEYVADERAARVGSSEAAAGMLDKVVTAPVDLNDLSWLAASLGTSVWQRLRDMQAKVPEYELERRRRLSAREVRHVADSHPPLDLRVEFVRSLHYDAPAVRLRDNEDEAIQAELDPLFTAIATELGEARRAASYA